ncbi:MAG: Rrf2 family transcriptional regulator [Dehalococcoidales bacterium]|nr:Rrf2 family transcriptional regulator [Dehalococcoidales bacterium]
MKLSTRTRYGTRALLELALRKDEGPVFLKEIAKQQAISLAYLEQLVSPLVGAGILRSTKGPRGGVSLAKKPEHIHLGEVTRLLEGTTAPVECISNPEVCDRAASCVTRDVWSQLNDVIDEFLQSKTLQDLVEDQIKKDQSESSMYFI